MIGDELVLRASKWCYQGVWAGVTKWLCVPAAPPELRGAHDQHVQAFRPAEGYLRYRKLFFWIGLVVVDVILTGIWLVVLYNYPVVGIVTAPIFWFWIIVPDIIVYIALHLRYDTTWYVLSDRTLRIRRGIWVINEVTITYENIQNVSVRQGPVQRYFGISDLVVQTAGGGGAVGQHGEQNLSGHMGLLEGIDNPQEVRELIMNKWRAAKNAGLGDEAQRSARPQLQSEHQVLREIRDLAAAVG